MLLRVFLILLLSTTALNTFSQVTIWSENFTGVSNGTTSRASLWSTTCIGCATGPPDYEVDGNRFKTYDINTEGVFTTAEIDISGHSDISITVSVAETGPLEASDYINIYYVLDNGGETALATNGLNSGEFTSATASQDNLNGSTLQLVIRSTTNENNERIYFDNILIQGDEISLPVELVNFFTKTTDGSVNISWQTASEKNNSHFELEKSTDGIHWSTFSKVQGKGTTSEYSEYTSLDKDPVAGTNYYRLKQVDINGTRTIYDIVSTNYKPFQTESYLISNNYVSSNLNISSLSNHAVDTEIHLINKTGKVMYQQTILNMLVHTIDVKKLERGLYFLHLKNRDTHQIQRIILH